MCISILTFCALVDSKNRKTVMYLSLLNILIYLFLSVCVCVVVCVCVCLGMYVCVCVSRISPNLAKLFPH